MKAIFWDLDGVLIDSMDAHSPSWKKSLGEFGLKTSILEMRTLGGLPLQKTISHIAKMNNKKVTAEEIEKIYKRKVEILKDKKFSIKPFDIYDDLKKLKQKNIKLFIVSGSTKKFVQKETDKFFHNIFDDIISSSDTKRGKPFPDPYLKALKITGYKKEDCVIIEDAPLGIKSAKSAGIKVFGITTSLPEKYLSQADLVFSNHKKLFKYLNSI